MRRLVPPWQPMTVVAETKSLADGQAILGLPGGLRWVAQHDPAGYDPPRRFVDVLSSDGLRSLAAASGGPMAAHPRLRGRLRRRVAAHPGARPGRGARARRRAAVDVRLPAPPAGRRPRRPPRRRPGGRGAARGGRDGRHGPGRLGAHGAAEHGRSSGHPVGSARAAGRGRTAMGSGAPGTPPVGGRGCGGAPGRGVHRGPVQRRPSGGHPRQPHRADAAAGRSWPGAPTAFGCSSAHPRSATTASTAATRCCARTAFAATASSPTSSPTGRPRPRPPPRRDCASRWCAPGSCRPPAVARCG